MSNPMRKLTLLLALVISTNIFALPATTATNEIVTQEKPIAVVSPNKTTFEIQLKSNPTTGYSWFLRDYNNNLLEPVKHEFIAPKDKKLAGAPGMESWKFKAKPAAFLVPQETTIRFVYMRPWEQANNVTQIVFKVISHPKP